MFKYHRLRLNIINYVYLSLYTLKYPQQVFNYYQLFDNTIDYAKQSQNCYKDKYCWVDQFIAKGNMTFKGGNSSLTYEWAKTEINESGGRVTERPWNDEDLRASKNFL